MALSGFIAWVILLLVVWFVVGLAWSQWNTYVTLDRRIEDMDEGILHSAGLRVESVVDAPQGSVIVPYIPVEESMPTQSVVPISEMQTIE